MRSIEPKVESADCFQNDKGIFLSSPDKLEFDQGGYIGRNIQSLSTNKAGQHNYIGGSFINLSENT
jgi:hypothetical protein